ncbi:TPA: pyrimidine utilization protein D, partial [Enterobacter hormaechei]|nr:pyrimidine utilization protein D [Enterobacter hormaechei]
MRTSRSEAAMKLSISPPPFAGAPVVVLIAGLG